MRHVGLIGAATVPVEARVSFRPQIRTQRPRFTLFRWFLHEFRTKIEFRYFLSPSPPRDSAKNVEIQFLSEIRTKTT